MKNKQDHFDILRKIDKKVYLNQRILAQDLGFSLGKLNYCLNALQKKGLVKLKNFKNNPNKFNAMSKNNYFYILTPRGITHKTKLTINFMKKKIQEYNELKNELEKK
tara:strand:+ start:329 stop:649 length:321 start_codon:yes stop_codon:yes gene_type:complete